MKRITQMLACTIFTLIHHICYSGPKQQLPGLFAPQYATSIKPSDFNTGPVVITKPGYYILTNDILFNPASPNSVDSYGNPWKAALIILADCVTIDLNTFSIQQDRLFLSSQFQLIQIGGTNVLDPADTTVYKPKQITIKNGCLSESTGYGIWGKNNNNIAIYDMNIGSCDNAGIFLENLHCSSIKNTSISGSTNGVGNVYGIFLRDLNQDIPEWTTNSLGTDGPSSVVLENIKICDIFTNSSLDTDALIIDLLCQSLNKLDISSITNLTDCVTSSLTTCITNLSTTVSDLEMSITTAKATPTPANIDAVIANKAPVLTAINTCLMDINALPMPLSSADAQLKTAIEIFQVQMDIVCDLLTQANALSDNQKDFVNSAETMSAWHAYGIRIANGNGIELKDCFVTGTNVDIELLDITRSTGIALDKCSGCVVTNCFVNKSQVNLGSAIGFSIATQSEGNYFTNTISTHHISGDESYGYWLCQSHCQTFTKCETSANIGVTKSKGFYFERSNANQSNHCKSFCMSCALPAANDPAQSIGFDSVGGDCNIFDHCEAYSITADSSFQNTLYASNLLASGFRLRSYPDSVGPVTTYDTNGVINNSTSRCIEGSTGDSAGILLDGSMCSTIRKNTISTSRSFMSDGSIGGNGYGIYDKANDSTALIVENTSYANQTHNYKVSYTLENEQLPVLNSTYGDMTGIFAASSWHNISLYANPGSTGCSPECAPNLETVMP